MKRILTAAALAAALLSSAPRAAAACPYKVGPFGRYIRKWRRIPESALGGGAMRKSLPALAAPYKGAVSYSVMLPLLPVRVALPCSFYLR